MSQSSDLPLQVCTGQSRIFKSGDFGPLWRVVEGVVRLDRDSGPQRLPVQLALPGDLVGIESLCDLPYQFSATAFKDCQLEQVPVADEAHRQALLRQALLQQQERSHDMATLRTGSVLQRVAHLLQLLGLPWQNLTARADAVRAQLPAQRELALVIDAKHETVCRALAQLLPPRSRKGGPVGQVDTKASGIAWPSPACRPAIRLVA
jgi:CRP-like cAMP-binding protein